ncbi:MAG: hypothetical protein GXP39_00600 [Chloroflexi bacterium]|nr:hypothetical protein [Chloroflexota bacterium]
MSTQPPDLTAYRAQPDAPITAVAWNALRAAILGAYERADELATRPGYITVVVRVRATDALVPETRIARVTVRPADAPDGELPVVRLGARYFIGPADPGDYRVTITPTEASGFAPQTREVTVRSGRPTEITIYLAPPTPGKVRVPDLFGRPLQEALNHLEAAELRPGRVVDSHGRAVTVTDTGRLGGGFLAPDPAQAAAPVIATEPGEDMEVSQGGTVHLLVAAGRAVPPEERITLDLNLPDPIETLDPLRARTSSERILAGLLFQGLTERSPEDGGITPSLAAEWEVDEAGAVWTFTLRPDIHWARWDRTAGVVAEAPITAVDAAFTLGRAVEAMGDDLSERFGISLAGMNTEALDDQTLRVAFSEPVEAEQILALLAHPATFPVPRERVEEAGEEWGQPDALLTSGPYVLTAMDSSQVILARNTLWHAADSIQIEQVRFLRIADPELAIKTYLAGELDCVLVPESLQAEVSDHPDFHEAPSGVFWLIRPWLTRTYPATADDPPLSSIHTWRLDWNAKKGRGA